MIESASDRHPIDVIAEEFVARYRRDELPSITEYERRYPELAGQLRSVLPTIVQMECLKRSRGPVDFTPMPEWLGDCRILREVGRGGMGVVYEAEQKSLGRRVAVKVLTTPALLVPSHTRRFLREAQTMAQLHHTNIVPVFEVGEHDGLPFYVMQFIDGCGLDDVIAQARQEQESPAPKVSNPPATRSALTGDRAVAVARIGLQISEALAYAHAQGTLHRDVKPSNILLDVRGTVWVTDFGLAKRADEANLTGPGETAGTLRYMPPERFDSQSDVRGDVYSLGLTLYELLTLRPAFDESDPGRLLQQVTTSAPKAPRHSHPRIPRDLETVILKAIARDPAHRYQTVTEMGDDLRRFLAKKPVHARRVPPAALVWRWCRRNPAISGLLAVVASLLVLIAVIATGGYLQTRQALTREANLSTTAQEQQHRAEQNLELALRAFDEIFTQATRRNDTGVEDVEPISPAVVNPEVASILQNMLKFYDQFGERNQLDPRLHREIAKAYRRVGDIEQRLGQFENAESAYRHALAIREKYATAYISSGDSCDLAILQNDLGVVLQMIGQFNHAEQMHRRALRTLASHTDAPSRSELARTHSILGSLRDKVGHFGGENSHRSALKLINDLLAEDPGNPEYQLAQARCYRNLCVVLARKGKRDDAVAAQDKAVTILDKLVTVYPTAPDFRSELGEVLMLSFYVWQGGPFRDVEADQRLVRARHLTHDLATDYPTVPQYQALQARALHRFAASRQGAGEDAESLLRDAINQHRKLVTQFPSIPVYQLYLAEACQTLSKSRESHNDLTETNALLTEAVAAQQRYLKSAPGNRFGWFTLSYQYQMLAETLQRQGEPEKAAEATRNAEVARKRR